MTANAISYVHGIIPDKANREKDDFYPTPPEATRALLSVETFPGTIWEPACGDGAISKILEEAGHTVFSTDLVDRGYGTPRLDFLMPFNGMPVADHIITNPPFKHAREFAETALQRVPGKVAMLCRLAWLEGIERKRLFEETPLARVWVFSGRLHMQRARQAGKADAGGMIAFAWFVWDHAHVGPTQIGWLDPRPFRGEVAA